ncbi:MAG: hypothetical protein IJF82_08490 [Achromobacter sp.]|nr:hypothetical protein [Achromobacter sp.]
MTQQDDITQRVRDNETNIASAAKEWATPENVQAFPMTACAHIAGLADALLSKLRAPVADERAAFEAWATAIAEKYDVTRNGDHYMEPYTEWVWEAWQASRAALASAPVAGEATYYAVMHGNALYGIFDTEAAADACKAQGHPDAPFSVKPLYAAPQASAEDVHNAALEEAAHLMEQTGKRIAASDIRALKTQAGKDGCQKRAVDVDLYGLAIECGAVISTDDLSWTFSYSAMRNFCIRVRAALSAPQAEQGERE